MPTLTRRISIAAPPEQVFDFIADHRNALRFMHGFTAFAPLPGTPAGLGARVRATGRMLGMPVQTTMEITSYERPLRLVSRSYNGVDATATWHLAPEGDGTAVVFTSAYELPGVARGPLKGLAEHTVATNTERTLANLKRALEAR